MVHGQKNVKFYIFLTRLPADDFCALIPPPHIFFVGYKIDRYLQ